MDICIYDSGDMHVNNRSIHIKARYTFCTPTIQVYLCCTPKAVHRVSFEQHISTRWALPLNRCPIDCQMRATPPMDAVAYVG